MSVADFTEFCVIILIPPAHILFYLAIFSSAVVQQFYQSRVIDEFVLKGNTGILKCLVPSFVTDFVQVEAWVADDGTIYKYQNEGGDFGNFLKCNQDHWNSLPLPCQFLPKYSRFPISRIVIQNTDKLN